jgi:hypothetical protein
MSSAPRRGVLVQRTSLSVLLALLLLLAACGDGDDDSELTVDDVEGVTDADEDDEDDEVDEVDEPEEPDEPEEAEEEPEPTPEPERDGEQCREDAQADGMEGMGFLEVVVPVEGQHIAGDLALEGCGVVPEGTVQYRLLDADGEVILEDFTTADFGGPEIGVFAETITTDHTGDATLEVYWDSPRDGAEEDLTSIGIVLE